MCYSITKLRGKIYMSIFSTRLKIALKNKNMRQSELCTLTGIPKSAMSQYVSGAFFPKQERLRLISEALNIPEVWLLGYDINLFEEHNNSNLYSISQHIKNIETIYPKNITAEYIIRFVRAKNNTIGSNIETMHLILDGKAEALEFRISENSPVSNITIESLELKKNILIACINRNGKIIIPRGKDMILPNDTVIVVTLKSGFADISDILE